MALSTSPKIQTDAWVRASWEDFAATMDTPTHEEGRGYFDQGYMRIEMAPLGAGHSRQNSVISKVISLFAMVRNLRWRLNPRKTALNSANRFLNFKQ